MTVTVNGEPFPPPDETNPWTRATIGAVLDAVTRHRRIPVRFEVHETDGSTFTEIIPAGHGTSEPPAPGPVSPDPVNRDAAITEGGKSADAADLIEFSVDGFVGGEEIAVAVVVAVTAAGPDGTAQLRLEPAVLHGGHEVVLYGWISGNAAVRRRS
ncbi:hypothetical protein [Microlunatus speluncae]|uniref:hypothetical protein n=1 Tax=Microlunatus speluncae TaxID=2594267 RepID=UPI0012663A12|nr:hypothetical protein [Microlunatus speluncae]